jgi:hypothetical protein
MRLPVLQCGKEIALDLVERTTQLLEVDSG